MSTQHKSDCKMAFGRKDASCPRCQELLQGAKPRAGYGDKKKAEYARWLKELKAHDCKKCNCGPVCTAFDW